MQLKWLTLYTHTTGPDSPTLVLAIYACTSVPNIYVSDVIFNLVLILQMDRCEWEEDTHVQCSFTSVLTFKLLMYYLKHYMNNMNTYILHIIHMYILYNFRNI